MRVLPLVLTMLLPATAHAAPVIRVLSNRADLVSEGDARVVIRDAGHARITLNGRPARRFFVRRAGRLEGIVRGMRLGRNVLRAGRARLVITNHPRGGPVFSGPQIQPWTCQSGALDNQCNAPVRYHFVYLPQGGGALEPYDPKAPAGDVATTTTDSGATVPFIVRVESGYQDRDNYQIATLYQPGKPWTVRSPQPQYGHKLLIPHGFGCDIDYKIGTAPSVVSYKAADLPTVPDQAVWALGRGWAVMATALDNNSHNCNVVTQAESLMMAKERLIERYGTVRHTIGIGCSGGSLAQQWIANAYPGIYQGVLPSCSFPDTWTAATQVYDYHLLRLYFEDPSKWGPGVAWTPSQWATVEGNDLPLNAYTSDTGFFFAIDPSHACDGVSDAQRYDPAANPGGVRCSIADWVVNELGRRDQAVWGPAEKKIGHGFAGLPIDNTGVQYGISALASGGITPAQFVDLNAKIGGVDIDTKPVAARNVADRPALARAYRSGLINETNNYDRTAIIDCRGPDPGAAHDAFRAFAIRARLDREHGTHANQLIWEGPYPLGADRDCAQNSLEAMDRWLDAVDRDHSHRSRAAKLVTDKPKDLSDRCYDGGGAMVADDLCPENVVRVNATPRMIAGDALTTDANKCRLKPLQRSGYGVAFTDDEWATLQKTFPSGVCDYSRPGVDQQRTIPWQTYQDRRGNVIFDGRPLGAAPRSSATMNTGVR